MKIALHDAERDTMKNKTFPNLALMKISAWHISNLKIYDKPKELGEFSAVMTDKSIKCKYKKKPYNPYGRQLARCGLQDCYCEYSKLGYQTNCEAYEPMKEFYKLIKPPQSWCYVEGLK